MPLSLQNFVNNSPPAIGAAWLNAIDVFWTNGFNQAQTLAQIQTAIGITALQTSVSGLSTQISGVNVPLSQQLNVPTTFSGATAIPQPTLDGGMAIWSNGVTDFLQAVPFTLLSSGVPFMRLPSGTMSNNGSFTLGTSMANTWSGYAYWGNNTIVSGQKKGWFWTVLLGGTTGTVYQNRYIQGQPLIPSSPTPWVSTGPGAWTSPTGALAGPQVNIPGNFIGAHARIEGNVQWTMNNTAGNKGVAFFAGGQNMFGSDNQSTAQWRSTRKLLHCRGQQNQVSFNNNSGDIGTGSGSPNYLTIDFTKPQPMFISLNVATATDWAVLESYDITVHPSNFRDNLPPPIVTSTSAAIQPPGAAALGISHNLFYRDLTGADVLYSAVPDSTHYLYEGQYYNSRPPYGTSHVSTVNGKMALSFGSIDTLSVNVRSVNQASGTVQSSYGLMPLIDYTKSFYVESAITYDRNDQDNFGGFYLNPVEHDQGNNIYPELDIDESGNDKDSNNPFYGSTNTYISWVSGTPTPTNNDTGGLGGLLYGPNLDRTVEHIFGLSYDATNHVLRWWIDGELQPLTVNVTLPAMHGYVVWDLASHGLNHPYNMYVRNISIWQ